MLITLPSTITRVTYLLCTYKYLQIFTYICVISLQESIDITIDAQNRSLKPFPIGKGTDRDYVLLVYLHNVVDIVHTVNYLQNRIRLANIPQFEITCWFEISLKLCATTCAIRLKVIFLFAVYIFWIVKVWHKFNKNFFIKYF